MIRIVMAFDSGRADVGSITSAVAADYARTWQHQFTCYRENLVPPGAGFLAFWNKVYAVRREIEAGGADWIMWLDSDALIVDPTFDLAKFTGTTRQFRPSEDYNGICIGVFLARASSWMLKFLDTLIFLGTAGYERDQAVFKRVIGEWPEVAKKVQPIPEAFVQNPRSAVRDKPFIYHYWSQWSDSQQIVAKMNSVSERGWSDSAR